MPRRGPWAGGRRAEDQRPRPVGPAPMARNLKVARNLKSAHLGEAGFGLGVMLFGMLVAVLTTNIPIGPAYSAVGPRVFPWLVSGALIVVGLMLLIESLDRKSTRLNSSH